MKFLLKIDFEQQSNSSKKQLKLTINRTRLTEYGNENLGSEIVYLPEKESRSVIYGMTTITPGLQSRANTLLKDLIIRLIQDNPNPIFQLVDRSRKDVVEPFLMNPTSTGPLTTLQIIAFTEKLGEICRVSYVDRAALMKGRNIEETIETTSDFRFTIPMNGCHNDPTCNHLLEGELKTIVMGEVAMDAPTTLSRVQKLRPSGLVRAISNDSILCKRSLDAAFTPCLITGVLPSPPRPGDFAADTPCLVTRVLPSSTRHGDLAAITPHSVAAIPSLAAADSYRHGSTTGLTQSPFRSFAPVVERLQSRCADFSLEKLAAYVGVQPVIHKLGPLFVEPASTVQYGIPRYELVPSRGQVVGSASYTAQLNQVGNVRWVLMHYTNRGGLEGILSTGYIKASEAGHKKDKEGTEKFEDEVIAINRLSIHHQLTQQRKLLVTELIRSTKDTEVIELHKNAIARLKKKLKIDCNCVEQTVANTPGRYRGSFFTTVPPTAILTEADDPEMKMDILKDEAEKILATKGQQKPLGLSPHQSGRVTTRQLSTYLHGDVGRRYRDFECCLMIDVTDHYMRPYKRAIEEGLSTGEVISYCASSKDPTRRPFRFLNDEKIILTNRLVGFARNMPINGWVGLTATSFMKYTVVLPVVSPTVCSTSTPMLGAAVVIPYHAADVIQSDSTLLDRMKESTMEPDAFRGGVMPDLVEQVEEESGLTFRRA